MPINVLNQVLLRGLYPSAKSARRADVDSGAYPGKEHMVPIADAEFEAFLQKLPPGL